MLPCNNFLPENEKKNQLGKEWANPQAAPIPPDGRAGCGRGKKFPGCGSGRVSLGMAISVSGNTEGGTHKCRHFTQKSHFKGGSCKLVYCETYS